MIHGEVNNRREAVVEIVVGDMSGTQIATDVIIDTGFTEYLTLPASVINRLRLPLHAMDRARLGDGTIITVPVYRARARVFESWMPILVQQSEGDILAGMALLDNALLTIEVANGGQVTISPLD